MVDSVDAVLESAFGAYHLDTAEAWRRQWDPEDIAGLSEGVPANPNIWTDDSRDEDSDALVGIAGAAAYGRTWGHAQNLDVGDG